VGELPDDVNIAVLAYQLGEIYKVVCDPTNPDNLQKQVSELKTTHAKVAGGALAISGIFSFMGTYWKHLFGGPHNG
jgi:hypothetical protein